MNIYFIKPGDAHTNFPHQYAVLSAYLKKLGHHTYFYDAALKRESPEKVLGLIDFKNIDALCISVFTGWHQWASRFTKLFKKKYSSIKVIVGGPHISGLRECAVEHITADYGIIGEGEVPLGKLLDSMHNLNKVKTIPGIIYSEGNSYTLTPYPLERVKDFNELPLPDYELVRPEKYFHTYRGASVATKSLRVVQTITSRGCPYMCTFCATNTTWEKTVTFYSTDRVIEEIKYLIKDFGIEEVWFGDDGFTTKRKRTSEICERFITEKIKIPWRLPNGIRLETIDDNLALLMKKAGCYMTGIGIETGSKEMMKRLRKRLDLDIVDEKVKILKKHKILASGFFIIGFPDETMEELKETIDFILKSPLERMQISVFAPYPGSEAFSKIFDSGNKEKYTKNIRKYLNEEYMPHFLQNLDIYTIQKYYNNVILRFYLKPTIIKSLIKNITLRQIKDITEHPSFRRIFHRKKKENDIYVELNN